MSLAPVSLPRWLRLAPLIPSAASSSSESWRRAAALSHGEEAAPCSSRQCSVLSCRRLWTPRSQ